jgi:hypothetical protein
MMWDRTDFVDYIDASPCNTTRLSFSTAGTTIDGQVSMNYQTQTPERAALSSIVRNATIGEENARHVIAF